MLSSISNSAEDSIQLMMSQMLQKMNAADTDGTSGLSLDEILSIDTSDDTGGAAFLKSLKDQFKTLDSNSDGQLSSKEIFTAKPPGGPMGPPPGMVIESEDNTADLSGSVDATNSADGAASTDSSDSIKDLLSQLLEKLIESFTESFDKNSESAKDAQEKIKSLISSADSDGSGNLSLDELSSMDTSNNKALAGFVNDLKNHFADYDTDGDGQLTLSELQSAIPKKQYSTQELAAMTDTAGDSSQKSTSLGSLSSSFFEKILSNYQNSAFSNLTSVISLVG